MMFQGPIAWIGSQVCNMKTTTSFSYWWQPFQTTTINEKIHLTMYMTTLQVTGPKANTRKSKVVAFFQDMLNLFISE